MPLVDPQATSRDRYKHEQAEIAEPRPDPMIERDLIGYGEFSPDPAWPGGARIAVNFNLNVEGGGESDACERRRRLRRHAE